MLKEEDDVREKKTTAAREVVGEGKSGQGS